MRLGRWRRRWRAGNDAARPVMVVGTGFAPYENSPPKPKRRIQTESTEDGANRHSVPAPGATQFNVPSTICEHWKWPKALSGAINWRWPFPATSTPHPTPVTVNIPTTSSSTPIALGLGGDLLSFANGGFEIASNDSVTIVYDYNSQGRVDSLSPGRMLVADNVGEFTSTGFGDFYVIKITIITEFTSPTRARIGLRRSPHRSSAASTISRSSGIIKGYGVAHGRPNWIRMGRSSPMAMVTSKRSICRPSQ